MMGMVIFSGGTKISLNQGQITPFGFDGAGCGYGKPHHRQSRRLCEVSPHGRVARKYFHALVVIGRFGGRFGGLTPGGRVG